MEWINWGGHCDWSIPKRGCLIGGGLWYTLINWGGRIQRIQKHMASGKKGLSNWGGGKINRVLTLSFDILSDISTDISSDVLSDISFDILSDKSSDISSDILSDISFGILSDISFDILSHISF